MKFYPFLFDMQSNEHPIFLLLLKISCLSILQGIKYSVGNFKISYLYWQEWNKYWFQFRNNCNVGEWKNQMWRLRRFIAQFLQSSTVITVESSAKASSFLVSVPLSKTSISTPRCISDYYLPLDFEDLVSSTESSLSPNSGQSSLSPVPYTSSDSREFSSAPGGSFTGLWKTGKTFRAVFIKCYPGSSSSSGMTSEPGSASSISTRPSVEQSPTIFLRIGSRRIIH